MRMYVCSEHEHDEDTLENSSGSQQRYDKPHRNYKSKVKIGVCADNGKANIDEYILM